MTTPTYLIPNPTNRNLQTEETLAVLQAVRDWDIATDGVRGSRGPGNEYHAMVILMAVRQAYGSWAVRQWHEQVGFRPLENRHRRTLDDVWRQVIERFGGNARELCGPTHDELIAQRDDRDEDESPGPTVAPAPTQADAEDAARYHAIRLAATTGDERFLAALDEYGEKHFTEFDKPTATELDAAMDYARRIVGEKP